MSTWIRSAKGKITLAAVAAVLVVAVILLILLLPGGAEEYRTITVAELSGSATVSNDKQQNTPAYTGMALFDGDTVTVAEGARLTVELDGDKYLMAVGGTTFRLEASGSAGTDKTVIHLESGEALTRIKNKLSESQSYTVKTPTSTISVRGTVFSVRFSGLLDLLQTLVEVYDGLVEMEATGSGARESIPAGMMAEADKDGFLSDEQGHIQQPIDPANDISEEIAEELSDYLADGEELVFDEEDLSGPVEPPHIHAYGEWKAETDNTAYHSRTCDCRESERAEHRFDQPVETPADEQAAGQRSYTCLDCGYQRTEVIPALTHTHTWSSAWSTDYYSHWHANTCQHAEVLETGRQFHTWDKGELLTEATHQSEGVRRLTCTVCGHQRMESIKAVEHEYGAWSPLDYLYHRRECECGEVSTGFHVWNVLTHTCLLCGYHRGESGSAATTTEAPASTTAEPPASTTASSAPPSTSSTDSGGAGGSGSGSGDACRHNMTPAYNAEAHFEECTLCGYRTDPVEHSGGAATCVGAVCEVCAAAYGTATEHIYGEGRQGPAPWDEATTVMIYDCIYGCGGTVTFDTLHTCDYGDIINGGEVHWYPCTTAGCPARLDYSKHSLETVFVSEPTHDTRGRAYDTCYCGYRGAEYDAEFVGYTYDLSASDRPDLPVSDYNYLLMQYEAFDPSKVKVLGLYADSYDETGCIRYDSATGKPNHYRELSPEEYEMMIFRYVPENETAVQVDALDTSALDTHFYIEFYDAAGRYLTYFGMYITYPKAEGVFLSVELAGTSDAAPDNTATKIEYEMDKIIHENDLTDDYLRVIETRNGEVGLNTEVVYHENEVLLYVFGHRLEVNTEYYTGITEDGFTVKLSAPEGYRIFAATAEEYDLGWEYVSAREITDFTAFHTFAWEEHIVVIRADALEDILAFLDEYGDPTVTDRIPDALECLCDNLSAGLRLKVSAPHRHTFASQYDSDENGHWQKTACGCPVTSPVEAHEYAEPDLAYDNETGKVIYVYECLDCYYRRTETLPASDHDHVISEEYQIDANYHWQYCTVDGCALIGRKREHSLMPVVETEATSTAKGTRHFICAAYCGHQTASEEYEFTGYEADLSNMGVTVLGSNDCEVSVGGRIDPTAIKLYGYYSDSTRAGITDLDPATPRRQIDLDAEGVRIVIYEGMDRVERIDTAKSGSYCIYYVVGTDTEDMSYCLYVEVVE